MLTDMVMGYSQISIMSKARPRYATLHALVTVRKKFNIFKFWWYKMWTDLPDWVMLLGFFHKIEVGSRNLQTVIQM